MDTTPKYNSLDELRRKKAILKNEVADLEHLVTFENAKESLSAFTGGFTDQFLKEVPKDNGGLETKIDGEAVVQKVREEVKEKVFNKNSMMGIAQGAKKAGLVDDAIKLGIATLVGNFAKKNINNSSWKKKIFGLLLIYLAPAALKFLREKLEDYQKQQSVSSMEQLI